LIPRTIVKGISETLSARDKKEQKLPQDEFLKEYLKELNNRLELSRRNLQFDKSAEIKQQIELVKKH